VEFTKSQVVTSIPGFFFCIWYSAKKHWLANNVLGIAFCIQGIEMLSLGSFKTGAILLGMKLLPMGRKSLFYLTIYGSAVSSICPQLSGINCVGTLFRKLQLVLVTSHIIGIPMFR
jgi:hypothetical protein